LNVLEPGVAVGVAFALLGLAIGLEAVAQVRPEARHRLMADVMPEGAERLGEVPCTLASPQQRGHRIAARGGIDEAFQVVEQGAIAGGPARTTGAGAADASAIALDLSGVLRGGVEFGQAPADGRA
jgi:hypothetical protein